MLLATQLEILTTILKKRHKWWRRLQKLCAWQKAEQRRIQFLSATGQREDSICCCCHYRLLWAYASAFYFDICNSYILAILLSQADTSGGWWLYNINMAKAVCMYLQHLSVITDVGVDCYSLPYASAHLFKMTSHLFFCSFSDFSSSQDTDFLY